MRTGVCCVQALVSLKTEILREILKGKMVWSVTRISGKGQVIPDYAGGVIA
jgi:hypothetical protein